MNEQVHIPTDVLPEGISSALDKLLANPQLISMVASALGNNASQSPPASSESPSKENEEEEKTVPTVATPLPSMDALIPLVGKLARNDGGTRKSGFKHEQLLCALKPYLSPSRCQAIDHIIRISQMSSIIGQLK